MPNVTMAFDEEVKGWTSEFTFVPDSALSLNNKFYTFHRGRVWQHNTENAPKNNYYGLQGSTEITFVFNEAPNQVKNFKTLNYEGLGTWDATIETNVEKGEIPSFIEKEGKNYAWIRGEDMNEVPDLSGSNVQGIGTTSILGETLTFENLPGIVTPGDLLFKVEAPTYSATPQLFGVVNSRSGNDLTFTTVGISRSDSLSTPPVSGDFIIHAKDNQSEKSGIIGYYSIVTMKSEDITDTEIFSAGATIFLSTK